MIGYDMRHLSPETARNHISNLKSATAERDDRLPLTDEEFKRLSPEDRQRWEREQRERLMKDMNENERELMKEADSTASVTFGTLVTMAAINLKAFRQRREQLSKALKERDDRIAALEARIAQLEARDAR